jgi:putative transposase
MRLGLADVGAACRRVLTCRPGALTGRCLPTRLRDVGRSCRRIRCSHDSRMEDKPSSSGSPVDQPRRLRRLGCVWAGEPFTRYFLTACTAGRAKVLANDSYHTRFRAFLVSSPARYGWHPLRYVVMPDHFHLLAVTGGVTALGVWMKALKAITGQRVIRWQTGYFDHVLRSDESGSEKWWCVLENPVRVGLVKQPEDWPFAGEIRFNAK